MGAWQASWAPQWREWGLAPCGSLAWGCLDPLGRARAPEQGDCDERDGAVQTDPGRQARSPLLLTLTLAFLFALAFSSALEGVFHQFVLHTPQKRCLRGALLCSYRMHALEHHPAYRGESYHVHPPDDEAKVSLGPYMLPAILVVTSPLSVLLYQATPWAAWTFLLTLTAYYVAYEFLHWHMHFKRPDGKPRFYHSWRPSRQLFEWFDNRHYIHHMADDRNFNVVLPLYDVAFGTYSTAEGYDPPAVRRRKARAMAESARLRQAHQRTKDASTEKASDDQASLK